MRQASDSKVTYRFQRAGFRRNEHILEWRRTAIKYARVERDLDIGIGIVPNC